MRSVDQGCGAGALCVAGGGNNALELSGDGCAAQRAELAQGINGGGKLIEGEESGGVLFDIRRDHLAHAFDLLIQPAAVVYQRDEFGVDLMIQRGIFLAFEDPCDDRSVGNVARGDRGIDGRIDSGGCTVRAAHAAHIEGAEGEVIIPREHGEATVFLVEIVVMDHGSGVAVIVAHEIVNYQIAYDRLHVHRRFDVLSLTELFERGDQPLLILFGNIGLCAGEDV